MASFGCLIARSYDILYIIVCHIVVHIHMAIGVLTELWVAVSIMDYDDMPHFDKHVQVRSLCMHSRAH
jgi:hypothetical protein